MDLLPLALRACVDRTAQAVLGDAVLESGWADERVTWMLRKPTYAWWSNWAELAGSNWRGGPAKVRSQTRARNLSRKRARRPTRRWCRAVAAALLFGEWSQERWPGIQKSWYRRSATLEATAAILRGLYSNESITEGMYGLSAWLPDGSGSPGSFLGIDREDLVKLYKPKDMLDLPPPRPRGKLLEAAERPATPVEPPAKGALVELWERELDGIARRARRFGY